MLIAGPIDDNESMTRGFFLLSSPGPVCVRNKCVRGWPIDGRPTSVHQLDRLLFPLIGLCPKNILILSSTADDLLNFFNLIIQT